jgi:hypothetical protein
MNQSRNTLTLKMNEVYAEYFNGNITDKELVAQTKNILWKNISEIHAQYIQHYYELQNMSYGGVLLLKNVLYAILVILVVVAISGYAKLYYQINERKLKNENMSKRKTPRK